MHQPITVSASELQAVAAEETAAPSQMHDVKGRCFGVGDVVRKFGSFSRVGMLSRLNEPIIAGRFTVVTKHGDTLREETWDRDQVKASVTSDGDCYD